MSSVNQKMAKGAAWMMFAQVLIRILSVVSIVVLARLLVPEDFGIVAMATSLIALLELATAFNFDIPLIQNKDAGRAEFDTAWTMNVLLFATLALVFFSLAKPVAVFYQEPRVQSVIQLLSVAILVRGFENIGLVYLRKELNFKQDFLFSISKKLAGFLVTIPIAFILRSYWALVIGIVVSNVAGVILSYLFHSYRPKFSLAALSDLFSFSKWLILNNALTFLRMRSPDFIIGRMVGSSALGLFTIAHEIAALPTSELVAPLNRAVFPGFSKLKDDTALLRSSYLHLLGLISLVVLPVGFGIAAISDLLVDLVLGSNWASAAPILAILSISCGIGALNGSNGSLYNAVGKPYLITIISSVHAGSLVVLSIVLLLQNGVLGVAQAYLAAAMIVTPVSFYVLSRQIACRFVDILLGLWRPLAGSCAMFAAVTYAADWNQQVSGLAAFGNLMLMVLIGAVVYATVVAALWLISGRPRSAEVLVFEWAAGRADIRKSLSS